MSDAESSYPTTIPALKEIVRQRESCLSALTQERIALESRASSSLAWIAVLLISSLSGTLYVATPHPEIPGNMQRFFQVAMGLSLGCFFWPLISVSYLLFKFRHWHVVGSLPHETSDSERLILAVTANIYTSYCEENQKTLRAMQRGINAAKSGIPTGLVLTSLVLLAAVLNHIYPEIVTKVPFLGGSGS